MKKEVSPALMAVILAVLAVVVIVVGYKVLGPKAYVAETAGGEDQQKKFQQTGEFYKPPAGMPPIGGDKGATNSGAYNLTPPNH